MDGSRSHPARPQRDQNGVDFLGLENCRTTHVDQLEHILLAHATYTAPMPAGECRQCHHAGFRRSTRPNRELLIWDVPRGDSPVLIRLTTWPAICSRCFYAQDEEIQWYDPTRDMTRRLRGYICARAATLTTFKQIALDTCQEPKTIQAIMMQEFLKSGNESQALPRILGIDEIYFGKKAYTLLVDIESGKAVDLLKGRSAESLRQRLEKAPDREAVEYVTQDFSLTYRAATIKPRPTGKKEKKRASDGAGDSSLAGWQLVLFAETGAAGTGDPKEEGKAIRLSRQELASMLPNTKIVGDHFHFAQAIVSDGFNAARLEVLRTFRKAYRAKMIRQFLRMQGQKQLPLPRNIPRHIREQADEAVEERASELERYKRLLFERQEKLGPDGREIVKKLLGDHPLLARAYAVKESGLAIFPIQPPLGRTKKSREAALAKRAKLRLTEAEAARRLDAWVQQVQKHEDMARFFKRALNMIRNWRAELIRIGTTGYSNGATESKNRYLRRLASISRGLEFETLRARLLWADAHHRNNRWPSFCDDYDGEINARKFLELAHEHLQNRTGDDAPEM